MTVRRKYRAIDDSALKMYQLAAMAIGYVNHHQMRTRHSARGPEISRWRASQDHSKLEATATAKNGSLRVVMNQFAIARAIGPDHGESSPVDWAWFRNEAPSSTSPATDTNQAHLPVEP